jgi:hypothetical protein
MNEASDRNATDWMWAALAVVAAAPVFLDRGASMCDDAIFYQQIAWNIVRTGVSTFNRVTPTNGYHPLWMLINVAAMWIVGGHRAAGLYAVLTIETVILAIAVLWYRRLSKRLRLDRSFIGISFLVAFCATSFWGMESHLSLMLITCSGIWFLKSSEDDSAGVMICFGAVLGLLILARLDEVFYAGAALVFASFRGSLWKSLGRALISGATACALVIPYLVFNYTKFGHVEPISGAIKGSFPQITGRFENLGGLGQMCAVAAVLGLALSFTDGLSDSAKRLIRAICTGVLLQSAYIVMFTHGTASHWYYVLGIFEVAMVADATVVAIAERVTPAFRDTLGYATKVAAIVIVTGGLARGWLESVGLNVNPLNSTTVSRLQDSSGLRFEQSLANWMNANIPEGSTILVADFPGRLAFYTDFRIVPLDGLVNDYDYNDEIVKGGISRFMARNDIHYYLGPIVQSGETFDYDYYLRGVGQPDAELIEVASPLYRKPAGTFEVKRADLLLDVFQAFGTTEGHGHLGFWRSRAPSEAQNIGADSSASLAPVRDCCP